MRLRTASAARRRRDQGLGIGAGPQRQHRQVPGRFGSLPAGQLVGPEGVDIQARGRARAPRRSSRPRGRRWAIRRGVSTVRTAAGTRAARRRAGPDGPSTITSRMSAAVGAIRQPSFMVPASTRCWIQQAPARVLPAPRPATYAQTRQSPAGGRWLGRARGCARHSPGGRPHGQDSAYQSQGERSVTSAAAVPPAGLSPRDPCFQCRARSLLLELESCGLPAPRTRRRPSCRTRWPAAPPA